MTPDRIMVRMFSNPQRRIRGFIVKILCWLLLFSHAFAETPMQAALFQSCAHKNKIELSAKVGALSDLPPAQQRAILRCAANLDNKIKTTCKNAKSNKEAETCIERQLTNQP